MRRIVGILAPLAIMVATAAPAWAHPGIEDPYVPAGRPTTVVLDVPAEEPVAMVGVDVGLPPDFQLLRLDQAAGWQSGRGPGVLHFTGGPAQQGAFVQFAFVGIFAKKAVLSLRVTTHAADGTERRWDGKPSDSYPATLIFPGYPRGQAPIPGPTSTSRSAGRSFVLWCGRFLVVAGAVTLIGLAAVRRKSARLQATRVAGGPAGWPGKVR